MLIGIFCSGFYYFDFCFDAVCYQYFSAFKHRPAHILSYFIVTRSYSCAVRIGCLKTAGVDLITVKGKYTQQCINSVTATAK